MKAICGKVLNAEELEKVQDRAALILCNLEKIFPPSFFTIMVHLLIHLPHEVILGGPVFFRWMYPIERYLEDVQTRLNRPSRNAGITNHNLAETYLFQSYGEPIGKVEIAELDDRSWVQAHRYVLLHHDSIEPLRKQVLEFDKYSSFLFVWSGKDVNDEIKWLSQGLNRI
ncbi:hypothetical protein J1N35_017727, partial [Gossypium stocksii]